MCPGRRRSKHCFDHEQPQQLPRDPSSPYEIMATPAPNDQDNNINNSYEQNDTIDEQQSLLTSSEETKSKHYFNEDDDNGLLAYEKTTSSTYSDTSSLLSLPPSLNGLSSSSSLDNNNILPTAAAANVNVNATNNANNEIIRRYYVAKVLGKGVFSKVRLGMHKKTLNKVALKIISKQRMVADLDDDDDDDDDDDTHAKKGLVEREIQHLRLCEGHPNLITLYDVLDNHKTRDGFTTTITTTTLVLEYAAGGDLLDYINEKKGGKLSNRESRRFFQQLVNGIEFMHGKNVVHRDLKLENLLLDYTQCTLKIADLGLSKRIFRNDETGAPLPMDTYCGSIHYTSPEILCNRPYMGPPADVWSAGVIFYSMLLGYLPFQTTTKTTNKKNNNGNDERKLHHRIRTGTFDMPSTGLRHGARELIRGMLCVDPQIRITIAKIKSNKWFKVQLPPEDSKLIDYHTVDDVVAEKMLKIYLDDNVTREDVKRAVTTQQNKNENENRDDDLFKDLQIAYRLELERKIRQTLQHPSSKKILLFRSKKNKSNSNDARIPHTLFQFKELFFPWL